MFVRIDKQGKTNYSIVKKRKTESSDNDLALSLEEARLEDVELIFIDERIEQEVKMLIQEAQASGNFSADRFSMKSFAEMQSEFVETKSGRFLIGKRLVYDAELDVDFKNRKYVFKEIDLGIESSMFRVDGTVQNEGKNSDIDLKIESKDGSITTLVELLPEKYLAYFGDFESNGTFFLNSTIKGRLNDKQTPDVKASFGLEDGKISSKKLKNSFKDVSFEGSFSNGKYNNSASTIFNIKNLKGYFNRELIEASLLVSNLDNPKVDFKLDGVLPLSSVYGLFNIPSITGGEGEIEIKDMRVKGRYKDMLLTNKIHNVKATGIFEFDDAGIEINGEDLIVDKGKFQLKGNSLLVNNIKIEGADSEIYLNGKFINILPVLFADSLNSKKAKLKFDAKIASSKLDIDRFVGMLQKPINERFKQKSEVDSLKSAQIQNRKSITNFLEGKLAASIDEFNYNEVYGEDFSGNFVFKNNEVSIKGSTYAMEGQFDLDGKMYFKDAPYLVGKANCGSVNVNTFFKQFENFGQEAIQDKNVSGTLDARLLIKAYWNEQGSFDYDKLNILGDIGIIDGELNDFELLYDFSDYVKIQDLKRIKFTALRNWLEVKKRKVYIPTMYVQSNAMNITVSGSHSFDNKIDYNLKINAAQVLFNKFKKHDPELKPIKPEKKGWFNLYYHVYGKTDNFQVKKDKKHVKRRFAQGDRTKLGIKAELKKAFGSLAPLAITPRVENKIEEVEIDFEEEFEKESEISFDEPEFSAADEPDSKPDKKESILDRLTKKKKTIPEEEEEEETEYLDFEFEGENKKKEEGGGI